MYKLYPMKLDNSIDVYSRSTGWTGKLNLDDPIESYQLGLVGVL